MTIYQKIVGIQKNLLHKELPKSGYNKFGNFKYHELEDILPVFAQFQASGNTGSNTVNWDSIDGWWCSCEDFHYRKHECKHIRECKKILR